MKKNIKEIKRIAIDEVLNPKFELTKQYMANNKLIFNNNLPVIEDVILNEQEKKALVYFPIFKENFYMVIIIHLEDEIKTCFINTSAGNRVELFVASEEFSLEELLKRIDIVPTNQWMKGEKVGCNGQFKHSGFIYAPINKKTGEVEDKLTILVNELLPRKKMILNLLEIADVEIQVTYYGYKDQMWGINLEKDLIKKISELNLSLDIDLYAGGNDLGD